MEVLFLVFSEQTIVIKSVIILVLKLKFQRIICIGFSM